RLGPRGAECAAVILGGVLFFGCLIGLLTVVYVVGYLGNEYGPGLRDLALGMAGLLIGGLASDARVGGDGRDGAHRRHPRSVEGHRARCPPHRGRTRSGEDAARRLAPWSAPRAARRGAHTRRGKTGSEHARSLWGTTR